MTVYIVVHKLHVFRPTIILPLILQTNVHHTDVENNWRDGFVALGFTLEVIRLRVSYIHVHTVYDATVLVLLLATFSV